MTTTATLPVEAAATATSTSSAERLWGILARVAPSVLVAIPVALAMAIAHLVWTPPSFRSEALLWSGADKHHRDTASASRDVGPREQEGWCLPASLDILELTIQQSPT
jgi:hypothetical protein